MDDVERPEPRTIRVSGRADVSGFERAEQVRAALFAVIRERIAAAIERRERFGLISSRGDAASTLFLDRQRIDALLRHHGHDAVAADSKLEASLFRRLAASDQNAPPLARGLARWGLERDDVVVLGAALASATDPMLARLLAFLGGDPSRPVLTVEAAAALLGDGHDAVLRVERMLAPGSALAQNALLSLNPSDLPFLRKTFDVHPRMIAILAGALEPEMMPLTAVRPSAADANSIDGDDRVALQAIASRRTGRPVIGALVGEEGCDLTAVLAAVVAADGHPVLTTPLAALGEPGAAPAIIREARLAGAVIGVVDVSRRLPKNDATRATQAIDVLAAAIGLVIVGADGLTSLVRPQTARVVIRASTSAAAQRDAALAVAAEAWLDDAQIADLPTPPASITRQQVAGLDGALSVLPADKDPQAVVTRALRDQGALIPADTNVWTDLLSRVDALWPERVGRLQLALVGPMSTAAAEAVARHCGLGFEWVPAADAATRSVDEQTALLVDCVELDRALAIGDHPLVILVAPRPSPNLRASTDHVIDLAPKKSGRNDPFSAAFGIIPKG